MADLHHWWGGDLSLSATGDLSTVDGPARGEQRIVRRLCTNGDEAIDQRSGEYLFHTGYGAGLPRYVGQPAEPDRVEGISRAQMRREASVLHAPEPEVAVRQDRIGTLTLDIRYTDAPTRSVRSLSFDVTG